MKSIVFYITYYPSYGGIEKVTTYLANYLCSQGYDVSIISFQSPHPECKNKLSDAVKLVMMPNSHDFLCEENKGFLIDYINNHYVDYLIYQDCYSSVHELLKYTNLNLSKQLIVCEHNSPLCHLIAYRNYLKKLSFYNVKDIARIMYYPFNRSRLFRKVSERHSELLTVCYKYVLLSDSLKEQLFRLTSNKYCEKVLSIGNPVTIDKRTLTNEANRRKQMLFVGRLVEDKGIGYLIDIWNIIEKKSSDWNLVIVGDGPLRCLVENKIRQLGLRHVEIAGARLNVEDYYQSSTFLLMTSIFEGFPLVLLEAMSLGVIPIAFNSFPALTDIINHGKNGFCVKPYDVKAYAQLLIRTINDQGRIKIMSDCAIEKSKMFNVELIGQQWIDLLS